MSALTTGIIQKINLKVVFTAAGAVEFWIYWVVVFCDFRRIGPIFDSYWIYLVRRKFIPFKISTTVWFSSQTFSTPALFITIFHKLITIQHYKYVDKYYYCNYYYCLHNHGHHGFFAPQWQPYDIPIHTDLDCSPRYGLVSIYVDIGGPTWFTTSFINP